MMNNCKRGMCTSSMIGKILLIVGGLNWGILGVGILMGHAMDWNVVKMILGSMPTLEAIVYVLVGVAAVMKIFGCKCKKCSNCTCNADGQTGGMENKM